MNCNNPNEPPVNYNEYEDFELTASSLAEILVKEAKREGMLRPPHTVSIFPDDNGDMSQEEIVQNQSMFLYEFTMRIIELLYEDIMNFPIYEEDSREEAVKKVNQYLAIVGWKVLLEMIPEDDGKLGLNLKFVPAPF